MNESTIRVDEDPAGAIRQAMKEENLNQTQVADKIGASRQSVQQFIGRKSRNMRVQTMVKLAGAIGYDVVLVKR
jgi:transcriptional regulator with XRE-family HTH domain